MFVRKQNTGTRPGRTRLADLFGKEVNFYGRRAEFNLQLSGETLTGQNTDDNLESLLLTRVDSSEVDRPTGPDPAEFKSDPDKEQPAESPGANETTSNAVFTGL